MYFDISLKSSYTIVCVYLFGEQ